RRLFLRAGRDRLHQRRIETAREILRRQDRQINHAPLYSRSPIFCCGSTVLRELRTGSREQETSRLGDVRPQGKAARDHNGSVARRWLPSQSHKRQQITLLGIRNDFTNSGFSATTSTLSGRNSGTDLLDSASKQAACVHPIGSRNLRTQDG